MSQYTTLEAPRPLRKKLLLPDWQRQASPPTLKHYIRRPFLASSAGELAAFIEQLSETPNLAIVQGECVEEGKGRRTAETIPFRDTAILIVDADELHAAGTINELGVDEFVRSVRDRIPDLQDCQIYYQLTGSQNPDSTLGKLRLFADLDRPYTQRELRAWAKGVGVDASIYNSAQIIYTSTPAFIDRKGNELSDPLEGQRFGRLDGRPIVNLGELAAPVYSIQTTAQNKAIDMTATQLERMVGHIPNTAATKYDEWLQVGMAIHHATDGSEEGYWIWSRWSDRSRKGSGNSRRRTWAAFRTEREGEVVTAGTLYYLARQHGYQRCTDESIPLYNGTAPEATEQISRLNEEQRIIDFAMERIARGGGVTAIADPVGIGKTRPLTKLAATIAGQLLYLSPRHDLHEQVADPIRAAGVNVVVYKGRDNPDMCTKVDLVQMLKTATGNAFAGGQLCSNDVDGEVKYCRDYQFCAYQQQQRDIKEAKVVIAAHEYLTIGLPHIDPALVVIDESFYNKLLTSGHAETTATEIDLQPIKMALDAGEGLDAEALGETLEAIKQREGEIKGTALEIDPSGSSEVIVATIEAWAGANDAAAAAERQLLNKIEQAIKHPETLELSIEGGVVQWWGKQEIKIKQTDETATEELRELWERDRVPKLQQQMADLRSKVPTKEVRREARKLQKKIDTPPRVRKAAPLLLLDADGDPLIYSALFGDDVEYHKGAVIDAEGVEIVQVGQSWHNNRRKKGGGSRAACHISRANGR